MRDESTGSDSQIKTVLDHSVMPLILIQGSPAESIVLALTRQNHCISTPFATEAGIFQNIGTPAVICGPGSVAHAHQPNEFIKLTQVDDCMTFLSKLAD